MNTSTAHSMPSGMISRAQKYKKLCTISAFLLKKILKILYNDSTLANTITKMV